MINFKLLANPGKVSLIQNWAVFSGIYLTCTMAITTLSMVLTVMVLNLHSISEKPVPRWMKILILHYLAKLFCRCDYIADDPTTENNNKRNNRDPATKYQKMNKKTTSNNVHQQNRHSVLSLHQLGEESDAEQVPIISLNGGVSPTAVNGDPLMEHTGFMYMKNHKITTSLKYKRPVSRHSLMADSETSSSNKPDYSKDWQKLAEIVDRLFFWIFLIAIFAISLLLFHPLAKDTMQIKPIR